MCVVCVPLTLFSAMMIYDSLLCCQSLVPLGHWYHWVINIIASLVPLGHWYHCIIGSLVPLGRWYH